MYAIRNKRTKKWVYGTDYRYFPPHQRTSFNQLLVYDTFENADLMRINRRCGKDYEIVPIKIEVRNDNDE